MKKFLSIVTALLLYASGAYTQTVTTIAGTGTAGYNGDGIPAASAELYDPAAVISDNHGNIYIAEEQNQRVRKVDASGIITTIAGTGTAGFSGDGGPATMAQLHFPTGLAFDTAGNLYISDMGNNIIRRINAAGIISTYAGTPGVSGYSGDGGPATAAKLWIPRCIAFDNLNNLYIPEGGNACIRKVNASGIITTVAGNGTPGFSGDGGSATAAQLSSPESVALDDSGNLFIADAANKRIRKVDASGVIYTIAGTGGAGYSGDEGPATSASFYGTFGIAIDKHGNLFISDEFNYRIREITSDGIVHTIAGTGISGYNGDGLSATSTQIGDSRGISVDHDGNILFADHYNNRVRRIDGFLETNLLKNNTSILLFPNPNNGDFVITALSSVSTEDSYLHIVNAQGQVVYNKQISFSAKKIRIHVNLLNLPSGIYVANMVVNGSINSSYFLIK